MGKQSDLKDKLEKLTIFVESEQPGNKLMSVNESNPTLEDLIAATEGDIMLAPQDQPSDHFSKHLGGEYNCNKRTNEMEE